MDFRPVAIGAAAFGLTFVAAGSYFVLEDWNSPRCDAIEVIGSLNESARKRLAWPTDVDYLLKTGGSESDREVIRRKIANGQPLTFDAASFRERPKSGRLTTCDAMMYVVHDNKRTFQFRSEYSVARSITGGLRVSASFIPD